MHDFRELCLKVPKMRFLAILFGLFGLFGLILHILMAFYGFSRLFHVFLMFEVSRSTDVEHAVYSVTVSNATQVREHFFWKTALRIFPKLGTHDQHDKTKKRTRPFVREKSGSLIIHENRFWPFSRLWWLGSTRYRTRW